MSPTDGYSDNELTYDNDFTQQVGRDFIDPNAIPPMNDAGISKEDTNVVGND